MVYASRIDGAELLKATSWISIEDDHILDAPIRRRAHGADGEHVMGPKRHRPACLIVDADDGSVRMQRRGRFEKARLGVEVGLHRRVEVQMIAGQIGETAYGETDSVHPAEFECVARHFHHRGVDAALSHHGQQCLKLRCFGCRQRAGHILTGDTNTDGADQPGSPARRTQPGLDQMGGGGLTGCAGHSQDDDTIRRMAVDIGSQCPEHRTRHRVHQDRYGRGLTERAMDLRHAVGVGEHRHRTGLQGRTGVVGAMRRGAG